jgi:thiamine-phosphate pyrophosphorylase
VLRYAISGGDVELGGAGRKADRLVARCAQLAQGGVEFLLVREKQLRASELGDLTRRILDAVSGSGTRVILAGLPEVALAEGADGVHVGSNVAALERVRKVFPGGWVSVSCRAVAEVTAARQAGPDAMLFSPVFGKTVDGVEVLPAAGLKALGEACAAAGDLPVFALGGVTQANAEECLRAGAAGVAGIRMFFGG